MATTLSNTSVIFNDSTSQETAFLGPRGVVFNTSNTFTIPTGITRIKITAVGGGGGSAGTGSGNTGGGGGGGGTSIIWTNTTPGNVLNIVVGQGGSGGNSTSNGSNGSYSGTYYNVDIGPPYIFCVGLGGIGGNTGGVVGEGGGAQNGDINIPGTSGGVLTGNTRSGGISYLNSIGWGGTALPLIAGSSSGSAGANGVVIIEY